MRILVWFRNNLRVRDNRALSKAVAEADEVIPLYVFDSHYEQKLPGGFPKTGLYRRKFLAESLISLREELKARGGDLIYRSGSTVEAISQIHKHKPIDAIYCEDLPTYEEKQLEKSLASLGIPVKSFWDGSLFDLDDLPFHLVNMPWVFTDFRKKVEKYCEVRDTIAAPEVINTPENLEPGSIEAGPALQNDIPGKLRGITYGGGEDQAWQRLQQYIWDQDRLKDYKQTRNGMLGESYSSKFSAALAHGCLNPVQIYHEVKRYEGERVKNSSTYWLIFELIWREFFRFTGLAEGNEFFRVKRGAEIEWTDKHEMWRMGETGRPLIDACMNELRATGYLGNRGRQLVASYLVNDMKQHWYPGAQWFESVLVDYDVTSNYGNWSYVAGVGHDPRKDRYFNIEKQAQRYDPEGRYREAWNEEKV